MSGARQLLIMARAPVPGACKTRLIPALGAEGAAALQRRLLRHALSAAAGVPGAALTLHAHPDTDHPLLREWAVEFGARLRPQQGDDLGERMAHALAAALTEGGPAVLIGCDSPGYTADYLEAAFAALEAGHSMVLGPAVDGGYVLIGLNRVEPSLFRDIPWGGERVAVLTRERAAAAGLRPFELAPLADIDHPEDIPPDWHP